MKKGIPINPTIGAYEAKTRFSQLLERVSQGEEIIITRHNQPIARLIPTQRTSNKEIIGIFEKLKSMRETIRARRTKDTASIKDLINEGRRF